MVKVKILVTTYNLENYISQALDSILNQKTDFPFKIVIADDASTDNTLDIIKKYKKKHQDKIDLILQERNVGSLCNSISLYEVCDAEYFAFLDGDDFWLTHDRLQKQVDFLEQHKDYAICSGNTRYLFENHKTRKKRVLFKKYTGKSYSINDYYNHNVPFVHTSSILFRNVIYRNSVPDIYAKVKNTFEEPALRGEDFRFLLHLNQGKMFIMEEDLSVYRIHSKGMWQGASEMIKCLESVIYYNFNKKYWKEHEDFFGQLTNQSYKKLIKCLMKNNRFMEEYNLSDKEHFYFVSLINDMFIQRKAVV